MKSLGEYYGGRTFSQVAAQIAALEGKGIKACVSILPRLRLGRSGIRAEKEKYLDLLSALVERGLQADITVKLSQFGERWDFAACVDALEEVCERGRGAGAFVWVDMEQSSLVDRTIDAFERVARRSDNVGLCLQTYLRRTPGDLERLLEAGWPVRLVKGYYREKPPAAWDTWEQTTRCFAGLIPALIEKSRKPAIGTHDPWLLEQAKRAAAAVPHGERSEPRALEFQFFLGARPELAAAAAAEGRPVRMYIPYGALLPYLLHSLPYMDLSRNLQRVLGFETIR